MSARRQSHNRHRQGGQAVLWFLAMIAACACTFALVYNVGQVTNKKEETINAADATALSGAVVQARTLNFEAYTNRAIVANEVAIAQIVSLDSWLQYDNHIIQWMKNYTQIIPILNSVTGAIASATQEASDLADTAFGGVVYGLDYYIKALGITRDAANVAGFFAANDVAGQIAGANATTFGGVYDEQPTEIDGFKALVLATNEAAWNDFTDAFDGDERKYGKDVILNSRDHFSTDRGLGKALDLINDLMALTRLAGNANYLSTEKTSGTTTMQGFDDWAGQDTIDLYDNQNPCGALFPCPFVKVPTFLPVGYGRVDADNDGSTGDNLCGGFTTDCELAVNDGPKTMSWSGMPSIRDIKKGLKPDDTCSKQNGSDSASLNYVSAVQKSGKSTVTTQRLGGPVGPEVPPMLDNLANEDNLTSIAAACTFFLRPDKNSKDMSQGGLARSDGVHEFASLYNPYWQARLAKSDSTLITTLYALIKQPGLDAVTQ